MFFLGAAAPVPRALCLAQWEAKPEGHDVPWPALKDTLLFFFSAQKPVLPDREGSRMGHCTASKPLSPSPAPVVPLSKPAFSASVFTLRPVARAVCSQWAVTLPPRMLLCIC